MNVSALEWGITLGGDDRGPAVRRGGDRPAGRTNRRCANARCYLSIYVGLAIAFGIWVWNFHGSQFGLEFFAGWLTEYSLSIDNLFIFIIIMASFKVPEEYQQQALLVGIVLALIFRGIFIALGAVAIKQFSWIFYLFGAFLVYTAIKLVRGHRPRRRRREQSGAVRPDPPELHRQLGRPEAVDQGRQRQAADDADVPA